MNMSPHPKFEEFKSKGKLPSPKGAAMQVIQLCNQDDVSSQAIARAIEADPALSGRIIKAANMLMQHHIRPVASVVDAVTILGFSEIRQIVLGLSLVGDYREGGSVRFPFTTFWARSLLTGIAARQLLHNTKLGAREEVFALGLLSQIGRLGMAAMFAQDYDEVLEKVATQGGLAELERSRFGFDHNQLTSWMLADWGLPKIFQQVAYFHEHPDQSGFEESGRNWRLLNVLHTAASFAEVCLSTDLLRRKLAPKLLLLATRLGIEANTLSELADNTLREWKEWARSLHLPAVDMPPFAELLQAMIVEPENFDVTATQLANFNYKLKILVVDDDRSILLLMTTLLTKAGHIVTTARNGIEALESVKKDPPQLIISDWMMPEMDGIAFCKALRTNPAWNRIYMFIVTAQESTEHLVEAFEAGVDDYISKPISPRVFAARLRAAQRVIRLQDDLEYDRAQLHKFADELAASNQRLQQLALTDALTELPNRRHGMDRIEQEWAVAKRTHRPLCCMMVDIDHFKQINDQYGHQAGDDALKQVAFNLRQTARKPDVVCRLGGEEFLLICPDTEGAHALQYAERLRQSVEGLTIVSGRLSFKLTLSIGIACKAEDTPTPAELLKKSDVQLYRAKKAGRNRCLM